MVGSAAGSWGGWCGAPSLFLIVDEVTPLSVTAESSGMKGSAQLGLVSRVTIQTSKLADAMSKLTFSAVSAMSGFLERSAHLGFVSTIVNLMLRALRLHTVSSLQSYAGRLGKLGKDRG